MEKNTLPVVIRNTTPAKLPVAKYLGDITLNGFKIVCAILEDGRRIFSERSLANAFGIKGGGAYWERKKNEKNEGAFLPEYLSARYLKSFISSELVRKFEGAFNYISTSGKIARGIDATVLTDICDVYITASKSNKIKNKKFNVIAENAYMMLKAFSNEGILRLIDRALGYKYDREIIELEVILKLYVSPNILEWQKTFHLGFYKELFRLWNIPFTPDYIRRKPAFIGTLTNTFVYKNLPKGSFILKRLKQQTPKTDAGNYKARLFQSLTPLGKEELKKIIYSVESFASISETQAQFKRLMQNRYGQRELPMEIQEVKLNPETKKIEAPTTFDNALKGLLSVPPEK